MKKRFWVENKNVAEFIEFCFLSPFFVIKNEILIPSMWNAVEKKLLLIELEWESILGVVYINKTTNNT